MTLEQLKEKDLAPVIELLRKIVDDTTCGRSKRDAQKALGYLLKDAPDAYSCVECQGNPHYVTQDDNWNACNCRTCGGVK